VTALAVARLLVRFRLRSLWNAARRGPRRRSLRLAGMLVLLAPVAYVGLFANAFALVASLAELPEQVAVLALAAGSVTLASAVGKMATTEAVVGGSGENEFLMTRPVSLATLVTARSLSGAITDFFDALFLFPILVAAALVWRLGARGAVVAAATSVIVQVGVTAVAQAGQILLVRLVPPARRRVAWSALALFAALTMACLWVVASWLLRQPAMLLEALRPRAGLLRASPAGLVVAPLAALVTGDGARALAALGVLVLATAAAVGLAQLMVRFAGRAGWEQAGSPWAEAPRGRRRRGLPLTPFTKDWYLIARDRSRLVTLVALPVIFVGLQVFGSAGWSWTTSSPRHIGVLAFSLAAYMATFGPLGHMQAERQAFWLLRVAPVPLGRLLAWKAIFWSVVVGLAAAVVGFGVLGVVFLGGGAVTMSGLGAAGLAVLGAVTVSWLAVAMGAGSADFSDDRRAIALTTVYLFLLVAGLFNVALLAAGEVRVRTLALYALAVALHWVTGVENAGTVFDPEPRATRRLAPGDGATLAILLFLGARAQHMAVGGEEARWAEAAWSALLAVAAAIYLLRRRTARGSLPLGVLAGLGLGAVAVGPLLWRGFSWPISGLMLLPLARALAEELSVRGVVQGALTERWRAMPAFAVAALMALAAGGRPLGAAAVLVAVLPGLVRGFTGSLAGAVVCRVILEVALIAAS
jgi:hypothetical protein